MNAGPVNDLATWFSSINHIMSGKSLPLPLEQILLLLMFTTACLILGRLKLGLIISHSFIFFWVFIGNRIAFMDLFGAFGMLFYLLVGLFMSVVMVFSFFQETH